MLARQIGQSSQFPSIEFATEDYTGYVGGCTPGYACAYQNTISWATPTTPLPMEINPRTAFERLFGDGGSVESRLGDRKDAKGNVLNPYFDTTAFLPLPNQYTVAPEPPLFPELRSPPSRSRC